MRIPRVFIEQPLDNAGHITISDSQAHYLGRVLRLSPGREIIAFNGDGHEYSGSIVEVSKRSVEINITQKTWASRESPLNITLAIGISKGDKMDWVLQKSVELGANHIIPMLTERTEIKLKADRAEKKISHWKQVMISACEQCQRNHIPQLSPITELPHVLKNATEELKLVLHHRSNKKLTEHSKPTSALLLIGPEGGLSSDEIQQSQTFGFQPLTLGPRILRTETAPIAALSALQFAWGDMN